MEKNNQNNRGYQPGAQNGYQPRTSSSSNGNTGSGSDSSSSSTSATPPTGSNAKDAEGE